jgi:hypothetical protein
MPMIKRNMDKIIVGIAVLVIAFMGILPPWSAKIMRANGTAETSNLGYSYIYSPPYDEHGNSVDAVGQLDFSRLMLQWSVVVVLAGGMVYISKSRPN